MYMYRLFIAALLVIVNDWKQPKYPSTGTAEGTVMPTQWSATKWKRTRGGPCCSQKVKKGAPM